MKGKKMKEYQTYMGHETWWNSFRMHIKMYKNIFIILFILDICLVGYLLSRNANHMNIAKTVVSNSLEAAGQFATGDVTKDAFFNYLQTQSKLIVQKSWFYLALLVSIPLLGYPLCMAYFQKRAKTQSQTEFIRGAKLFTVEEINQSIKKSKAEIRFKLGNLSIPRKLDVYHTGIVGSTGSGKTYSYFAPLIANLMEESERGIIHCAKGEFTSRFLKYEDSVSSGNLVYNPLDKRSVRWTVFNDIVDITDIDRVSHRLIPNRRNVRDPSWDNGARDILTGLLHYAHETGQTSNRRLRDIFTSPITEKLEMLKKTDFGAHGRDHLADPASKMAQSYNSIFMLHIDAFRYMQDGDFSISSWVRNKNQAGFIFLMNNPRFEDTLRPALTLFMDIFASKLISMDDNPERKVFLILDEFSSLNNLPSVIQILRLGRSKGAAVSIGVQEFGQIDKVYGKEDRQTILGNLNNFVVMRTRDTVTSRELSDLFGETEYYDTENTTSAGVDDFKDGVSFVRRKRREPLVLPSEIQNLPQREAYVYLANLGLTKTDISCRRLYLDENELNSKPASTTETFILREGLTLQEILERQHRIEEEARKPLTGEGMTNGAGLEKDMGEDR